MTKLFKNELINYLCNAVLIHPQEDYYYILLIQNRQFSMLCINLSKYIPHMGFFNFWQIEFYLNNDQNFHAPVKIDAMLEE